MPPRICKFPLSRLALTERLSSSFRRDAPRTFSSSPRHRGSVQRSKMYRWLNNAGRVFKDPLPGSTNYLNAYDFEGNLIRANNAGKDGADSADTDGAGGEPQSTDMNLAGDRPIAPEQPEDFLPFPENPMFVSQSVLSEPFKDAIYNAAMEKKMSIREVSELYQVDMKRVGAVIRLKDVEKRWIKEGKKLATTYSRAITAMLPKTELGSRKPHESINDLVVHRATMDQLFYPTSESRHFTRVDAGQVFQNNLLPAERRIPHSQMVRIYTDPSLPTNGTERKEKMRATMRGEDAVQEQRAGARRVGKVSATTTIPSKRAEYKFEDVRVERWTVGRYSSKGVGFRYGVPPEDRKKGQVKIPRRVG